ncbi:MAG: hypothetical protein ACHP9Z_14505 [Streptosporangiales bacterium]
MLLDTAQEGQTRVAVAEAADLIRGAVRMRLWPAAPRPRPRSVRAAVRLMCAGALAELAVLVALALSVGHVRAVVLARHPATWPTVLVHMTIDMAVAPLAIGLWLCLAWANGRGLDGAQMASAASLGLLTLALLAGFSEGALAIAPAAMIAAAVEAAIGLLSVVLIFTPASCRYYRSEPALR